MKKAMLCLMAAGLLVFAPYWRGAVAGEPAGATVNGDVNCSGQLDLADAIFSLNYLFLGGEEPCPFVEAPGGGPEIAALEAELAGRDEELATCNESLATRDVEVASLRRELTQAQVDLSGALRDLITTQRDLLSAEARILELEAAQGPCAEQIEELQGSLATCNSDLEAAGVELEEARQQTESAQLETETARQETEEAQAERDTFIAQLDECENPRIDITVPALDSGDDQGVSIVAGKIDLLERITPTAPEAVLAGQEAATLELGTISAGPDGQERILIYDAISRALCSVDLCEGDECEESQRVKLHYNADGLVSELVAVDVGEPFPALSDTVPAVTARISRGPGQQRDDWVIAYEPRSRSVVGFRALDGYRPVRDNTWPDDDNFGRGNGLVMSVIISGVEIRSQLGLNSPPPVTRIVYLGSGQLLLFFAGEVLPAVHLLELEAVAMEVVPDFAEPQLQPVWKLRGNFLLFGEDDSPYLGLDDVRELTGEADAAIDGFQPFVNPTDGSALVFESVSGQFLRVWTLGFEEADEIGRSEGQGNAAIAIDREAVAEVTGITEGGVEFTHAASRGNDSELLLVEERSNTVLAYDYTLGADEPNLTRLFEPGRMADGRFDPGVSCDEKEAIEEEEEEEEEVIEEEAGAGAGEVVDAPEPVLQLSEQDTLGTRLVFDRARGELVAVDYTSGRVVLVARGVDLSVVTGVETVDLVHIRNASQEAEGAQKVMAWDSASSSLIELRLENILTELCR